MPTAEQQADLLTKSLPSPAGMRFTDLVFGIAHFATYAQLLGSSQRLNGYNQLEEECGK